MSQPRSDSRTAPVFTTGTIGAPRVRRDDRSVRPFVQACRMCYDRLVTEFQDNLQYYSANGHRLVRLSPNLTFTFQTGRGDQQWQLHTLLYGKKTRSANSFYKREQTHQEYGILNPFVAVQFQLYQAGFYLTNISDPDKSFTTVFEISRSPPSPSAGNLRNQWHGQQRLLFDPVTDSDFLRKYIEKIYLNDIASVADFLNTMFAQTRQSENVVQTIRRALCPDAPAPAPAPVAVSTEEAEPDIGYDDEDDAVGGLGRPE